MNWTKVYDRLFYSLLASIIISTIADFMVSYTVYCYASSYFIAKEMNQIFRVLIPLDAGLALILLTILTGQALWMVIFLRRMSLYCIKHGYKRNGVFIGVMAISLFGFGSFYHLAGALRWTYYVPLPFID